MSPQHHTAPLPENPPLVFKCGGCGLALSIDSRQAGISGPCPSCGTWITSPGPAETTPPQASERAVKIPHRGEAKPPQNRVKGRIPADSIVDQAHLEQQESAKTLKVLALFVLVICCCLATAWFLRDLAAK